MSSRTISVSAAAYDGHAFPEMLDSLAACGASHVEPAFIVGYTEPFDESIFTDANARRHAAWLDASGIACLAFSAHLDLGGADALRTFPCRMDFASRLGARIINTNAAVRANEAIFFRNIAALASHAGSLGMTIALENPGDGRAGLFDTASDGLALVERIGSPHVRLNYDPGNTVSHRPSADAIADAVASLPACAHLHLKAVRTMPDGWCFVPLGQGDLEYGPLLAALSLYPDLPVSVEMPLRMRRGPDAQPWRRMAAIDFRRIEAATRQSLEYLRLHLPQRMPSTGA